MEKCKNGCRHLYSVSYSSQVTSCKLLSCLRSRMPIIMNSWLVIKTLKEWRSRAVKLALFIKVTWLDLLFFGFTPEIAQRLCRVIWDLERGHYMDMRCFSHSWQRKMGRRQPEALLLPCLYSFPMWTEWGSLLGEYVTCPVELLLLDFPRIAWVSLKRNVLFVCF